MAVTLHGAAGEAPAADNVDALAELLEFLDKGDEIGVATDDRKAVDMRVRKAHLERIDDQIDISTILVASRGDVALHHMNGVIRQCPAMRPGASPVPVGALGDHLSPLLQGVEDHRKIEGRVESRLHTDFDIVEIDKDRELITLLHAYDLNKPSPEQPLPQFRPLDRACGPLSRGW